MFANIISSTEPKSWTIYNKNSKSNILFLCDHASSYVPKSLVNLGLSNSNLAKHIAYDIGIYSLTKKLAKYFNATMISSNYSRLVLDLNRDCGDISQTPPISDNIDIKGNLNLTKTDKIKRINEIFHPYHNKISKVIDKKLAKGQKIKILSMHSFTNIFNNENRPWHISILTNTDRQLGSKFINDLQQNNKNLIIGDNQPYSGLTDCGYTIIKHGIERKIKNALFEVRQDLINSKSGQLQYFKILVNSINNVCNLN